MKHQPEKFNLILAVVLSAAIILAWQFAYEMPRQKLAARIAQQQAQEHLAKEQQEAAHPDAVLGAPTRESALAASPRVNIRSATLHGSVALKGLRFDDLTLAKYRETIDRNSPEVVLLSPAGDVDVYFAQVGWLSSDTALKLPGDDTVWSADSKELTPGHPVTFSWNNGQGH